MLKFKNFFHTNIFIGDIIRMFIQNASIFCRTAYFIENYMFFPHLTSPLKGREPLEFQFSSEKD